MKNNTFDPWIKISSSNNMNGTTRGIEISSDFHFRSFYITEREFEPIKVIIEYEKGNFSAPAPEDIFTEINLLTPEQQTLLKDKISGVDFKMLKDEYIDLDVCDGGGTTFEIIEGNFSKRIIEGNFEWEDTEYEPLARLIGYIYNLCYTEK